MFETNENKLKDAGIGPFKKLFYLDLLRKNCERQLNIFSLPFEMLSF